MKWIVVCISLFLAVSFTTDTSTAGGSAAPVSRGSPEASAFLHKAFGDGSRPELIRASYSGACGGWITDADGQCVACYNDQRPMCDDNGNCGCEYDKYCHGLCKDAGNCGEEPTACG